MPDGWLANGARWAVPARGTDPARAGMFLTGRHWSLNNERLAEGCMGKLVRNCEIQLRRGAESSAEELQVVTWRGST